MTVPPRRFVRLYAYPENPAIRRRARNPAHDFMYPDYFGGVVLLAALGEFEFFFTDLEMLADAKSDCRAPFGAML